MTEIARRGVCLVLCAPSGGGKGAITEALLAREPALHRSVSVTTRAARPGEVDGVHYRFVTADTFAALERNGELLEWARVLRGTHGYGTPRAPVEAALAAGNDVLFDIDWQGFRQLRDRLPGDVVGVFILPPGLDVLEQRLRARGDDPPEVDRRMREAREEISHWQEFDFVVVNDELDRAVEEVRSILRAARVATPRQLLSELLEQEEWSAERPQTIKASGELVIAPAPDRFVRIDHSSPEFAEADATLTRLAEAINNSNEIRVSKADRLSVVSEIAGLQQAIRNSSVRLGAIWAATRESGILGWLQKEVSSASIRALATAAVAGVLRLVGLL